MKVARFLTLALLLAACTGMLQKEAAAGEAKASTGKAEESHDSKDGKRKATVFQATAGTKDVSRFMELLKELRLEDDLSGPDPLTIFAPTDEAFERLGPDDARLVAPNASKEQKLQFVARHIVRGNLTSSAAAGRFFIAETGRGGYVRIDARGGGLMVQGVPTTGEEAKALNGTVHTIAGIIRDADDPKILAR
jgi:uncharacterized surface protein with fasciclin (FAS1) repeats